YMMAAMILDGNVLPEQYEQERILKDDIQELLQKVQVNEKKEYSDRFPDEMVCDITFYMKDGKTYSIRKTDYEGFHTRPASRKMIRDKFRLLTKSFITEDTREKIIEMIENLEDYKIRDLMEVLRDCQKEEMIGAF